MLQNKGILENFDVVENLDNQAAETISGGYYSYTWYKIKYGDTLSGIALSKYGNANMYHLLHYVNRDTIYDPNKIYAGKYLRIPQLDEAIHDLEKQQIVY